MYPHICPLMIYLGTSLSRNYFNRSLVLGLSHSFWVVSLVNAKWCWYLYKQNTIRERNLLIESTYSFLPKIRFHQENVGVCLGLDVHQHGKTTVRQTHFHERNRSESCLHQRLSGFVIRPH